MNRYLAELKAELEKIRKASGSCTDKTDKRAFVSNVSTRVGPFPETKLPAWCSASCPHLEALESPQGKLAVCRQELDDQIRWVRLSFLENCPMKNGLRYPEFDGWPDW